MKTKVIVLPVYQKHWLWYGYGELSAADIAAQADKRPWTQGATLQEKLALLGKEIGSKVRLATAARGLSRGQGPGRGQIP